MRIKLNKTIATIILIAFTLNVGILYNYANENHVSINESEKPESIEKIPKSADVSGNELYAEQVSVTLANNHSLIRQSMITNDTNIMDNIDLNDPAFYRASFFISWSNGKESPFSPLPTSGSALNQIGIANYPLYGFLFYEPSKDYELIQIRKNRAISILKETFEVDLIIYNAEENATTGYFYPFFGYYPKFDVVLQKALGNAPKDGYWKLFDKNRILNPDYLENQYLSVSILYLRSFEAITKGLGNYAIQELGIIANLGFLNITDILTTTINSLEGNPLLGMFAPTGGNGGTGSMSSLIDSLAIEKMLSSTLTNVVLTTIEYEGMRNGINQNNNGTYTFNLYQAMNYSGAPLTASEKSYNSFIGVLLSGIDISVISAEVLNTNPKFFYLSESKLRQLEMLIFLTGIDFDIEVIKSYRLTVGWQNNEYLSRLAIGIENYRDETDPLNFLSILGFIGFPLIFGALIDPISEFQITYQNSQFEPYLSIERNLVDSPVNKVRANATYEIVVKNNGNEPVYGAKINLSPLNITNDPNKNLLTQTMGYNVPRENLINLLTRYNYNTTDIFIERGTRLFLVDSFGQGIPDYIYPEIGNLNNIGVLAPYSPIVAKAITEHPLDFINLIGPNAMVYATLFNSSGSIFNPDNWVLSPGENFSYTTTNANTTIIDTFQAFYTMNVSIQQGISPIIAYGTQITANSIGVTSIDNNTQNWGVRSQNLGNQEYIQTYFVFQNTTEIEFAQKTIDALNITMFYQTINNLNGFSIELYNFSSSRFMEIGNQFYVLNPTEFNLLISSRDMNITDFYNINNNYSIIVRLTLINSTQFDWNIRFIRFGFLDRILNTAYISPAVIRYSTEIGANLYTSRSKSLILSNDEMSLITATAKIDSITSYCGEANQYNLTVSNIGTQTGYNITISIRQPGIIIDPTINSTYNQNNKELWVVNAGKFLLDQGSIQLIIPSLAAGQTISNLTFRFYTPNSQEISPAIITWEDYRDRRINASDFRTVSNSLYISAPILYTGPKTTPYIHQIEMSYISPTRSNPPRIGETFEAKLKITNVGRTIISDLSPNFAYNISGLSFKTSQIITLNSLAPDQHSILSINYTKTDFRGYMLPAIRNVYGFESKYSQIKPMSAAILGEFNITIQKSINTLDEQAPRKITVTIQIQNLGNIEVGNLTVNDVFAYDAKGFTLVDGAMIKFIPSLEPGASIEFSYTLILKQKGNYIMDPAEIQYYFVQKLVIHSERYEFKVREPYWLLTLRIYGPILFGAIAIYSTYKLKLQYNQEDLEFERREALLFGQNLRDIAWTKKNITEFLDEELTNSQEEVKAKDEKDLNPEEAQKNE